MPRMLLQRVAIGETREIVADRPLEPFPLDPCARLASQRIGLGYIMIEQPPHHRSGLAALPFHRGTPIDLPVEELVELLHRLRHRRAERQHARRGRHDVAMITRGQLGQRVAPNRHHISHHQIQQIANRDPHQLLMG